MSFGVHPTILLLNHELGNKPIHLAAKMDNDDVVRFLNDKHEIMTVATNHEGMTPLDVAEYHNSMQVSKCC